MINDIITILLIAGIIMIFIWMQFLDHRTIKPDDGGREKHLHPKPPEDMLFEPPPVGSVVFGKYKGKYVCRPKEFEGAILVCGGSGCGKSAGLVKPYLINCNRHVRSLYGKRKKSKKA